jgi:hypothetical protein
MHDFWQPVLQPPPNPLDKWDAPPQSQHVNVEK